MLKRTFDMLAAGAGLIVLSPLLAAFALIVRLESAGPILFQQTRVGKDGRRFAMYKFRTMPSTQEGTRPSDAVPQVTDFKSYVFDPLYGGKRFTRIGGFLRSASLDELPNLFNVFRGDMSVVGPRPEVPELVEQYPPEYERRHAVRPGITGLAQVHGFRGEITDVALIQNRINLDLEYINNWSIWLDIGIILKTFKQVFFPPDTAY